MIGGLLPPAGRADEPGTRSTGVLDRRIILLSGPVSAGKTTLALALEHRWGVRVFKTQQLIRSIAKVGYERAALQRAGEALDRRTKGRWVVDALTRELALNDKAVRPGGSVVVDAVRITSQIEAIREAFGARVAHVHLVAPLEILSERYLTRSVNQNEMQELASYDEVRANRTEARIGQLERIADLVVNTARSSEEDVLVQVSSFLGLYGRSIERLVDVLVGGQFGSEGKGHIASYLAPEYDLLVRVGGPNAGHTVYEEPRPYTYHHLPSGTRSSSAALVLGPGSVIWPEVLLREIAECDVDPARLAIDPQAMIIEEQDRERESGALVGIIGSTGQGVGVATARKILRSAAEPAVRLAKDLTALKPYVRETQAVLEHAFVRGQRVLLEGTQGTGLSLHHGHYPFVTSRDTSVSGCLAEAGIAPSRVRRTVMVCRTYPIRVQNPPGGTSGPIGKEVDWEEIAQRSGLDVNEIRRTEITSTTKRQRRVAEFGWTELRRAATLNGPTDVAVSFVDYLDAKNRDAYRFDQLAPDTIRFIEEVERVAGAPVSLVSTKFHFRGIIDRRAW